MTSQIHLEIQEWIDCSSPELIRGKEEVCPGTFRLYDEMGAIVGYIDDLASKIFVRPSLAKSAREHFTEYTIKTLKVG